jgi:hypothetical protein
MKKRTLIMFALLALSSGFSATASADSVCKGLAQAVCEKNASCRWVQGYTRNDGVKTKSYCRISKSTSQKKISPKKKQS